MKLAFVDRVPRSVLAASGDHEVWVLPCGSVEEPAVMLEIANGGDFGNTELFLDRADALELARRLSEPFGGSL